MKSKPLFYLFLLLGMITFSACEEKLTLEDKISKMLEHPEVQSHFEDELLIVIIKNDICNLQTVNVEEIKSSKDVRLFTPEEVYMRLIENTMEIIEQKQLPGGGEEFKLKLQNEETLTFEFN